MISLDTETAAVLVEPSILGRPAEASMVIISRTQVGISPVVLSALTLNVRIAALHRADIFE